MAAAAGAFLAAVFLAGAVLVTVVSVFAVGVDEVLVFLATDAFFAGDCLAGVFFAGAFVAAAFFAGVVLVLFAGVAFLAGARACSSSPRGAAW